MRRPTLLFAGIFLIWQFLLKVLSTLYLDLFGPVYANEVGVEVGGKGSSTLLLVAFVWIPLAILYFFLGPRKKARPPAPELHVDVGGFTFANLAVWFFALFIIALYVDMFRIGVIPLIDGIERFDYIGGVFHSLLSNFVWLVGFAIGYIFSRSRIVTGAWDLRCLGLTLALFIYLFLAGHRFGAFYVIASFMGLALASIYYSKEQGWAVAAMDQRASRFQKTMQSPTFIAFASLLAVSIVVIALINNLYFVRDYGDRAGDALVQRLFVQPVELYWLTWDRVSEGEVINGAEALHFMFNDPFDATRNSGMQYLMMLYLGDAQAFHQFVDQGQDYAGGYPEILIELGGVWIATLAVIVVSIISGLLYRLCVVSVSRGHFLTAMMSIYLCFGILGIYLGGMLNFLLVWTYWFKLGLLIFAISIDWTLDRFGLRLFPWVLIRRRGVKNETTVIPSSAT